MTTHYDRETLTDYLHGALSPRRDAAVFAHLEGCDDCRRLHDEEAALGEALRRAALHEERELPAMVRARVWDAVRRERPSWRERFAAVRWGPVATVPVAAALILGVYLGVPAFHASSGPAPVTAALLLDVHNAEAQTAALGPGIAPAVYASDPQGPSTSGPTAGYLDAADAATLDDADAAVR